MDVCVTLGCAEGNVVGLNDTHAPRLNPGAASPAACL